LERHRFSEYCSVDVVVVTGTRTPQEIVLWSLLLPLLCATFVDTRFRAIALVGMGSAGACLLLTKFNIGAFYCFAILQTFTYLTLQGKRKRIAAAAFMAIAILLPRILMDYYFHDWAFRLCVFAVLATFAMTFGGRLRRAGRYSSTQRLVYGGGWARRQCQCHPGTCLLARSDCGKSTPRNFA
jgi:hypothetical protein